MNKYFILLFQYDKIYLYTEIKNRITRISFANGKEYISNCVSFSYDKEDLEFLPDGDPFEVNSNSSFSDYLDFAGYHFEAEESLETIMESIIKSKLIPGLGPKDALFLVTQSFYFESEKNDDDDNEKEKDEDPSIKKVSHKAVLGHETYIYSFYGILNISIKHIRDVISENCLFGFPFLSIKIGNCEDHYYFTAAPTIEWSALKEIQNKYPLSTHIPEKLLRNIKNKIIVSKLYNLPLPEKAIYQNRIIDIKHEGLSERFEELMDANAKIIIEKTDEDVIGDTYVFDFGMYPKIKEAFLTITNNPVFVDKKYNELFIAFILRNMIIQHNALNDPLFRKEAASNKKTLERRNEIFKSGSAMYYELRFIQYYSIEYKKGNPLNNQETKDIKKIKEEYPNASKTEE